MRNAAAGRILTGHSVLRLVRTPTASARAGSAHGVVRGYPTVRVCTLDSRITSDGGCTRSR